MRRYTVRINETDYLLDVEEVAPDTFTVVLDDGGLVKVQLTDHQDLAQAVITPTPEAAPHSAASQEMTAVRSTPPPVSRHPDYVAPAARRSGPTRPGAASVTAPMPGVILSVEVAVGATVQRGQTLLVLEAMKMKNDIKAERDGTVAAIEVAAGDQVKHGDVLLQFQS